MTKLVPCLISALVVCGSAPGSMAQGASTPPTPAPQAIVDDALGSLLGASNCIVAGEILIANGEAVEDTTKAWREVLIQLNDPNGNREKVLAAARASYGKYGDTPAGMSKVKEVFKLCADKHYRETYIDTFGVPAATKATKQGGG